MVETSGASLRMSFSTSATNKSVRSRLVPRGNLSETLNSLWSSSGTSSLPMRGKSRTAETETAPAMPSIQMRWCSDQRIMWP